MSNWRTIRTVLKYIFAGVFLTLLSNDASAHVKWFATDLNCGMQPQLLTDLLKSSSFFLESVLFFSVMLLVAFVDRASSRKNGSIQSIIAGVDAATLPRVAPIMRYSVAIFFVVAVFYYGKHPVYLTPELKAFEPWIPEFELALACTLMLRKTAWMGALGICFLYGMSIRWYGWFHLMDYPIFIGIAALIAIDSIYSGQKKELGLAIMRFSVGVTLMWAGGEKWLYPWWSYPILKNQLSGILFGMHYDTFMYLCGFVEFCAAYALTFGRSTTQLAALFLLLPFISAIPVFGALDAIGHSPIIVALVLLTATRSTMPDTFLGNRNLSGHIRFAFRSFTGVFFVVGAYWLLHFFAYPQSYKGTLDQPVIAILMILPVTSRLVRYAMNAVEQALKQNSWTVTGET